MAKIVKMPKLGLTMTEGTIVKWNKKEGEAVDAGEVLLEVATDKLTNEVQADESGVVRKILAQEDETVECLKPIAIIAAADEDISAILEEAGAGAEAPAAAGVAGIEAPEKPEEPANDKPEGRVIAAPAAKKLALEKGIDISLVAGTGPNGRIVIKDVEDYLENEKTRIKVSPVAAKIAQELNINVDEIGKEGRVMKADVLGYANKGVAAAGAAAEETVKLSQMRKTIAAHMSSSWATSPRVTFNIPVDTTAMRDFRAKANPMLKEQGIKISFNHILMKACAKVLMEMPAINGSLAGDMLTIHPAANIGLAVGLDEGLVVPNVKNCDAKSLSEIAALTDKLVAAARGNKLTMEDMTGGTFTITNLGAYGITSFSPIINQPELAILGVNAIVDTPVVVEGQIVIKPLMNLSLTADHRIVDGVLAAKFLQKLTLYLENPCMLLI
jgi:pyruvate dehydrogenase E2 component (dihydrolipoamide acetyltransferase)